MALSEVRLIVWVHKRLAILPIGSLAVRDQSQSREDNASETGRGEACDSANARRDRPRPRLVMR